MTPDMWITLAILATAIFLFVTELLRVDIVALGVVVALMATGILTTSEAIAGFSSSAVLTIASLFVVGGAVLQTGLAAQIASRILKVAGTDERRLTVFVMLAAAVMSGFISDTGVVAVMLPAIIGLAGSARLSTSRLLIPLAFGSLLGGVSTLIGTPPNIIVADLIREELAANPAAQLRTLNFFDFTPLGVLLIIAGIAFMLTIGRRLLPDYQPKQTDQQFETPAELFDLYRLPDNLFRLRVRSQSPLRGKPLVEARLGQDFNLSILEVLRPREPRRVMQVGSQALVLQNEGHDRLHPDLDLELQRDDVLIVRGEGNDVGRAAGSWNFAIQPAEADDMEEIIDKEVGIAEVVLPPRSSLIDKSLRELRFGSTYKLTVLDIRRAGSAEQINIKDTPLQFGDTLLVQGEWRDISRLKGQARDFVVMGEPEAMVGRAARERKAPIALLVLLGMTVLIVSGESGVTLAAMLAALAMVLTRCLTMDEAYDAIDWKSLVLIGGMLPMATALQKVGLVDLIASGFTDTIGQYGALATLGGLVLLTAGFTQVLSNTATAVLVAPIGLEIARQLGVNPLSFMVGVAVAASMAFASPVASPVNTLVMGAGNYKFRDYIKVGIPMILLCAVITLIVLPFLFPF